MSRHPLEVVQAVYEAFGQRDVPRIFGLFSPEIEIRQSEQLPWGGRYRGHAGAQQFLAKLTTNIDSTLEIERLISAGDQVAAIGWTQGVVNATGASYRVAIAHVWTVRDGLVAKVEFLIDHPAMLAALGRGQG